MRMKTESVLVTIGALVTVLAAVGLGAWLIVPGALTEARANRIEGTAVIEDARNAVLARFPQPAAVTFGKIYVNRVGELAVVCGYADLADPYDSIDRPERFTYLEGELMIEQADGTDAVAQKWRDVCV